MSSLSIILSLFFAVLPMESPPELNGDPAVKVTMTNTLKFNPEKVTIEAGETVLWENTTYVVHTVTCDPEKATMDRSVQLPEGANTFGSGKMEPGNTFEYTFETKGTFKYFCEPHEGANMSGTVIVE